MKKLFLFLLIFYAVFISLNAQYSDKTKSDTSRFVTNAETKDNFPFNLYGFIAGTIGIIGTIYTIASYVSNKKDKRINNYLYQIAEKNLDHSITIETLNKKQKEVEDTSRKIELLKQHIKKELPKEARKAVLKDKHNTLTELIVQSYKQIVDVKKELTDLDGVIPIPTEIRKAIEDEISPQYLLAEKRNKLKTYLTILTTLSAILSTVLVYPFDRWISAPILVLFGIPITIQLLRSYWPTDPMSRKVYTCKIIYRASFILSGLSLFISIFNMYLMREGFIHLHEEYILLLIVLSIMLAVIGLIFYRKYRKQFVRK